MKLTNALIKLGINAHGHDEQNLETDFCQSLSVFHWISFQLKSI